jgi:hypothetical protein
MTDLRFDVSNPQTPDAGPVIYISTDADKWGRLTITLTNTRSDNSDITLDPGGVLQIYFEMLTPADIERIKVPDDSAWAGGPDATGGHLELHPKSTITIPSQTSISLELHDVLGETPRQGKFRFYYQSLGIRNVVIQGFVQRPPDGDGKQWSLAWMLDPRADYQNQGNTVYVTAPGTPDIANYLLVHLYRSAGGTLPSAGTPQLSVSFLTGDGDLALCSQDRLKNVTARIKHESPSGRWKDPAADSQGDDIVWTVSPTDGGGDLFPEGGLLTLEFDNIITDLPAGDAVMFIQYSGLTGYDDGYIQVPVLKIDPVLFLRSLAGYSGGAKVETGGTVNYGPLTLAWEVVAADEVVLRDAVTGTAVDPPFHPKDSTTLNAAIPKLSYELIPRVDGVDQPRYGIDFSVAPATAAVWLAPGRDSDVVAQWEASQGSHCTLYQDGTQVADNLPLTGKQGLGMGPPAGSTVTVECHGATVARATASIEAWFHGCRGHILAVVISPLCDPKVRANFITSSFAHKVCSDRRRELGPDAAYAPVEVVFRGDEDYQQCYTCCGNVGSVSAIAMAVGTKPAHEIAVGETIRVAEDGGLTRWSERPVAFSSGIGSDPAHPVIAVEFGEAADRRIVFAARNQLFLMPGGVLKRAARLAAGRDVLMREDGTTVAVAAVTEIPAPGGLHHVATSKEPATELAGHLIIIDGIVCGDYALQVSDLESVRPELMAQGREGPPHV